MLQNIVRKNSVKQQPLEKKKERSIRGMGQFHFNTPLLEESTCARHVEMM